MNFRDVLPTDEEILEQEAFLEELDEEWKLQAKCHGMAEPGEPNPFFPKRGDNAQIEATRKFCSDCPVKKNCLGYALDRSEKYGMWGGLGETARRAVKKQRLAVAA